MLHLSVSIPRILDQVSAPDALLYGEALGLVRQLDAHGDVNGSRCKQTRLVLIHLRVEKGELEQVL